MIVIFHIDDYRVVYYTIIMAVYFTDIIYIQSSKRKVFYRKLFFFGNFILVINIKGLSLHRKSMRYGKTY